MSRKPRGLNHPTLLLDCTTFHSDVTLHKTEKLKGEGGYGGPSSGYTTEISRAISNAISRANVTSYKLCKERVSAHA